jgi:hypothetical protein
LGNGVPVAAAVGRRELFGDAGLRRRLGHLEREPAVLRAVLATLDEFDANDVLR